MAFAAVRWRPPRSGPPGGRGHRHKPHGVAAGLHALVHLPATGPTEDEVVARAAEQGLAVSILRPYWHTSAMGQGLIVGYATPTAASYPAALAALAHALHA